MNAPEYRDAMDTFATFHHRGGTRGKQGRSPLRRLLQPFATEIDAYLATQFFGLCAYTEVGATVDAPLELAWHRPPSDATALDGAIDRDHYWWLALDHRNWYLASPAVSAVKHNSFPVLGPRMAAPILTDPKMPNRRGPLDFNMVLDPCEDSPSFWLRFERDGAVTARDNVLGEDRGGVTIRTLDLGNTTLADSRRDAIKNWISPIAAQLHESEVFIDALARLREQRPPHAAALAQNLIRSRLDALPVPSSREIEAALEEWDDEFINEFAESQVPLDLLDPDARALVIDDAARVFEAMPNEAFGEYFQELLAAVVADPDLPTPLGGAPSLAPEPQATPQGVSDKVIISPGNRIKHVEIKNFRAIVHLALDVLPDGEPGSNEVDLIEVLDLDESARDELVSLRGQRWKMLLGENGSGKSSILHAIALALAGTDLEAAMTDADLVWDDLLRWGDDEGNRPDGRVVLTFTGGQKIDLRFNDRKHWFWGLAGKAPAIHINIRGYGAARFPATGRSGAIGDEILARALTTGHETSCNIANLLDSTMPILNANAWLGSLDDEPFNVAAETLSDLLGESSLVRTRPSADEAAVSGQRITRSAPDPDDPTKPRKVLVDGESLSLVSDGYKSVIALGCEIMAGVGGLSSASGGTSDFREAIGVVLIDEIGAHLHPRWRMQITGKLRKAFPEVQFFVTTHEPLCLRGLVEREVVRVTKYEDHGVLLDEIDRAPGRYRVDQLLTSEFFGLNSAIDPKVDRLFAEYYNLKRVRSPSSLQLERLEALEAQINDKALRPILGYTRRDQLIFEAIDRFLINDPLDAALPAERKARRNEIVSRVASIWNQFADGTGGSGRAT